MKKTKVKAGGLLSMLFTLMGLDFVPPRPKVKPADRQEEDLIRRRPQPNTDIEGGKIGDLRHAVDIPANSVVAAEAALEDYGLKRYLMNVLYSPGVTDKETGLLLCASADIDNLQGLASVDLLKYMIARLQRAVSDKNRSRRIPPLLSEVAAAGGGDGEFWVELFFPQPQKAEEIAKFVELEVPHPERIILVMPWLTKLPTGYRCRFCAPLPEADVYLTSSQRLWHWLWLKLAGKPVFTPGARFYSDFDLQPVT